jgi:hypothetical protein
MTMRCTAALAGLLMVALVAGSCGGSDAAGPVAPGAPTTTVRPDGERLTPPQANALAQALLKNFQAGGARVIATIPFGASTFTLDGAIDWQRHVGAATVTTTFRDGVRAPRTQEIFWSRAMIATPLAGLEEAMAARGREGVRFVARPIDGSTATLDRVVAFLDAIASDRAENPLLLRQRPEVAYLGREEVDGISADRYQASNSAQFWLSTATGPGAGRIVRIDARFAGLEEPVGVRLREHGAQTLSFPPDAQVVVASEVPDLIAQLTDAAKAGARTGG